MTPTEISAIAGVILSLLLAYLPGVKDWFEALPGERKRLLLAGLLALAAGGALLWGCYQLGGDLGACMQRNWQSYITGYIGALVANQATYLLAVRRTDGLAA